MPKRENPLLAPARYPLHVLLKELRFGRPAAEQHWLYGVAAEVEEGLIKEGRSLPPTDLKIAMPQNVKPPKPATSPEATPPPASTGNSRVAGGGAMSAQPDPRRTEKEVQQATKALYRAAGGIVYDLSQPRATKQTPGIPDLYVFLPRAHCAVWHEVKAASGKASPAQQAFLAHCLATRTIYVMGGVSEARNILEQLGLVS